MTSPTQYNAPSDSQVAPWIFGWYDQKSDKIWALPGQVFEHEGEKYLTTGQHDIQITGKAKRYLKSASKGLSGPDNVNSKFIAVQGIKATNQRYISGPKDQFLYLKPYNTSPIFVKELTIEGELYAFDGRKEGSITTPKDLEETLSAYVEKFINLTWNPGRKTHSEFFDPGEVKAGSSEEKKESPTTFLRKIKFDEAMAPPEIEKDGFYCNPDLWFMLVRNLKRKINTLLVGPTGTGKTELVTLIAKKLGIEITTFDFGAMHDPIPSLLGVHRIDDGKSVYDYSRFSQQIQKPGVILMDELSRAPAQTNNIIFPLLDSRRQLPMELAMGTDKDPIHAHQDCGFFATANVGFEYTGTSQLDAALVNRFMTIELEHINSAIERDILVKRTGITFAEASHITYIANTIRQQAERDELSNSVSLRETLAIAELVIDGFKIFEALKYILLPKFEGSTDLDGERGAVLQIISSQ